MNWFVGNLRGLNSDQQAGNRSYRSPAHHLDLALWDVDLDMLSTEKTSHPRTRHLKPDEPAPPGAEAAAPPSEMILHSALQVAPIGIGVILDRVILEVNSRLCELTGYAKEELVGQRAEIFYAGEDEYRRVRREKARQIRDCGTAALEGCWKHKSGKQVSVLLNFAPLEPGDPTRGLSFTALDITPRKQAEEALRNSEERFRDLVEMLPEAVFETDQYINLTFANRCAFELFGYSREDLAAGINGLDIIVPQERERVITNLTKRLQGEEVDSEEYQALKKDGSTFPILFHASSIWREGQLAGLRGIIIDLTARKQMEAEKARIADQFRQAQKVESIGRLAGGVSHDLNNLLAPIIGYGEMLLDDLGPQDRRRASVREILRAGFRARDLVRQLLAFSRKQTMEYLPLDLNETIAEFETLLRRTIREDIEIVFTPAPDLPGVMADAGQIEQVIMNLVVNAADAMPDGGRLAIETSAVRLDRAYAAAHQGVKPGDYVMLAVSDTGYGMDDEIRDKIFDPFFSTKGEQGTGLGLATVYGIVKQHGGNIWVYSEIGKGTTFKVYLPVSERPPEKSQVLPRPAGRPTGKGTILLVEDNDQLLRLVNDILSKEGYTVLTAKSGPEALERIKSLTPSTLHLLLTDVVMPKMNGKQLSAAVAEKHPGVKVLYMSGYTDNVIAHHGILDEGAHFIQKPFSVRSLSQKVHDLLKPAEKSN